MNDRIKPDDEQQPHRPDFDEELRIEHRSRYAIDEHTGLAYVKSPRGARKVTSEEIRELLEDFP